ncbi:glycoside hydrolase family 20 zincin-like fold domain-containing protein [Parabacteroides distasonis]|nr:glycoside hydrolase family 20 zincin-like fold domain-containing protein [Parabacteroides distasonis]
MILVKCFLPDEKPEIIPFPLQSVSDKGDFTFNKATLISVENEKQAMIARELTDLFTLSAGFTPEIKIQDKRANIIFRTDRELAAEHYKLNIAPSCILSKSIRTKRFLLRNANLTFSASSSNKQPNSGREHSMERTGNDHTRWPPIQQSDRGNTHTFHSHLEG